MPPAKAINPQSFCPCGSEKRLCNCCLPLINGQRPAPTAEALMRSRYTAHVLLAIDYLWDTWCAQQRVHSSQSDIRQWADSCEWLHLKILATQAGAENDLDGLVTFEARYRQHGEERVHHEISLFKKSNAGWLYIGHQGIE